MTFQLPPDQGLMVSSSLQILELDECMIKRFTGSRLGIEDNSKRTN